MKEKYSTFFNGIKKFSIKKIILILLAVVIAGSFLVSYLNKKDFEIRDQYTVTKNNVTKTVLASGKVISETDLALSFQRSDIVRSVNVKVGDKVTAGKVIASLSNSSEQADLTRAKGVLLGAEARYRKLLEGASNADIIAAEDALRNAIRTQGRLVDNARRTLFSDGLIAEPVRADMNTLHAPTISGIYLGNKEGVYNLFFEQSNKTLSFSGLEKGEVGVLSLQQPLGSNGLSITFPESVTYAFNDEWTIKIPNKTGKNYTANLNAYNAALASGEEIVGAAKSKLDILKTDARKADLDAAMADVLVARAGVSSAEANLEKTIIRAPASGTITKIDIKLGDLVEANKPVVSLQDVSNLYVESNVNEADIMGVKVGQGVDITFEALGKDKIFKGEISLVNLGATTNNSVVNYKVKALLKDPGEIRSGMTADIKVTTLSANDVIAIPVRYIGDENNQHYVYVIENIEKSIFRKQIITKGESVDGGIVIVKDGLKADDIIAIIDEKK